MNTQNSLGIWISQPDHLNQVDKIISHYNNCEDIFLICDDAIYDTRYAIVSSYYVNFYDMMIAFLDLEDLVINKNHIRSTNISLFCNSAEILQSKLDKSFFKDIKVIEI